jgi:hypothetical protein
MHSAAPVGFQAWAVVEVFDHESLSGYVTEETIGGTAFLRVDVPAVAPENRHPDLPAFTRLLSLRAVKTITPVSEAAAREAARRLRTRPLHLAPIANEEPPEQELQPDFDLDWPPQAFIPPALDPAIDPGLPLHHTAS